MQVADPIADVLKRGSDTRWAAEIHTGAPASQPFETVEKGSGYIARVAQRALMVRTGEVSAIFRIGPPV